MLTCYNKVARDDQLINTAKDYLQFVTKFFEVISASATHIYHSALEVAPLSSIVRQLYYHQRLVPFPKVVVGIPDLWEPSISVSLHNVNPHTPIWSPCGQFAATQTEEDVKVLNVLTLELLSTLQPTKPSCLIHGVAYSPDGHSLACLSTTSILVWDIQTGGVAKEIQLKGNKHSLLVWSLDGRLISTISQGCANTSVIYRFDVASNAPLSPITLLFQDVKYLWAHNKSFQVMTTMRDCDTCTINILEVGPTLVKIESTTIQLEKLCQIKSFSPATYHISISIDRCGNFLILAIQDSECLLHGRGDFFSHHFSPNGSLFAASKTGSIQVWKYNNGCYIPWREFQCMGDAGVIQFSPNLLSILVCNTYALQMWHLDGPPVTPTIHHQQLTTFSCSSAYTTAPGQGSIIKIVSHTNSQFIDTGTNVMGLGLTFNVLLVVGPGVIVAWLLDGVPWKGGVEGVPLNEMADHSNSIWTVPLPHGSFDCLFFSEDRRGIGFIKSNGNILHVYNTETGEVFKSASAPPLGSHWYPLTNIIEACGHIYNNPMQNYPPEDDWEPLQTIFEEGWVKDVEGTHLLWVPVGQRGTTWDRAILFSDILVLQPNIEDETFIIKLC